MLCISVQIYGERSMGQITLVNGTLMLLAWYMCYMVLFIMKVR